MRLALTLATSWNIAERHNDQTAEAEPIVDRHWADGAHAAKRPSHACTINALDVPGEFERHRGGGTGAE